MSHDGAAFRMGFRTSLILRPRKRRIDVYSALGLSASQTDIHTFASLVAEEVKRRVEGRIAGHG